MTEFLGNITSIKTGKLDVNAENINGKYPFFTCSKQHTFIDSYAFEGESILVAGNGDLNVKYYNGKFNAYQRTYVIQPLENLDAKYLYYFLTSYLNKLRHQSIGGVIKYIKLGNLTNAEIPLPPLKSQQKIAAILDKADRLVQLNRQLLEKYAQLAQSLFLEMFGDPVSNPKGWNQVTLGNLASEIRYGSNNKAAYERKESSVPVLRIPNIGFGKITLDDIKYSNVDQKEYSKLRLQKGDLLFVRSNGNPDYIGRCAMFDHNIEAIYASYLIKVKLTAVYDQINPLFLSFHFNNANYRKVVLREAKTTAGNYNINTQSLKRFKLINPPMDLQSLFMEKVQLIEQQKTFAQQSLQKSQDLFQSLLQKAFKGELVKEESYESA